MFDCISYFYNLCFLSLLSLFNSHLQSKFLYIVSKKMRYEMNLSNRCASLIVIVAMREESLSKVSVGGRYP